MFCLCTFSSTVSIDGRMRSSRSLCWRSRTLFGPVGCLGPLLSPMLAVLGPMLAILGRSWDLCWQSWAALGAYVGGLRGGSGPKLAVLACLGAKVVGLGSGSRPKLKVLACLGAKAVGLGRGSGRKVALARAGKRSGQEIRPKSGPNPSGSAIQEGRAPRTPHNPP